MHAKKNALFLAGVLRCCHGLTGQILAKHRILADYMFFVHDIVKSVILARIYGIIFSEMRAL